MVTRFAGDYSIISEKRGRENDVYKPCQSSLWLFADAKNTS